MKIVSSTRSVEPCQEAGWVPFRCRLDGVVDESFVMLLHRHFMLLRPQCSLVFMRRLARPFFKIEAADCLVKGLVGDDHILVAVDGARIETINELIALGD